MPKINWQSLPLRIKQHLIERLRERQITQEDLEALKDWIGSDPEVPEGPWWKDFATFKLVGEGKHPKSFLTKKTIGVRQEIINSMAGVRGGTGSAKHRSGSSRSLI